MIDEVLDLVARCKLYSLQCWKCAPRVETFLFVPQHLKGGVSRDFDKPIHCTTSLKRTGHTSWTTKVLAKRDSRKHERAAGSRATLQRLHPADLPTDIAV